MATEADIKPWLRPPPRSYLLYNANVVDVAGGTIRPNVSVRLSNGKIDSITPASSSPPSAPSTSDSDSVTVVDCTSRFLCPGLIDSHVHLVAVPGFASLDAAFGLPAAVTLLRQPYVAAQMLHRGFTTVRDCGGAGLALKEAIAEGVIPGPRLFISGHALSQAGGHGDLRSAHEDPASLCCGGGATNGLGRLCNGAGECAAAAREELRPGADFIKIMGSGGVASPTDRLEQVQFTAAEVRAVAECAAHAGVRVTAHAYTPRAIRHCLANGVGGIEHGNFLDGDTARLMAARGAYLTPTLVTYAEMAEPRWAGYLPAGARAKNARVLEAGIDALRVARDAGVAVCFGTDLLGPLGHAQTREFVLRAAVLSPLEVLRSATTTPARMLGQEGKLGQVEEGFEADILFLAENPLDNVTLFDEPDKYVLGVMKAGRVYKSRWDALVEDAAVPVKVKL